MIMSRIGCLILSLFFAGGAVSSRAVTISLDEAGALTGWVDGSGTVTITFLATDHWKVAVHDVRIGNPVGPAFSLGTIEPEHPTPPVSYNNIQELAIVQIGRAHV